MKISKYHLSTDILDEYDLPDKQILFSTRTGSSLLVDSHIYQNLLAGNFSSINEELIATLKDNLIIVDKNEDEFHTVVTENDENRESVDVLSMTIQPSANCQLGCYYCAQNHTKDYASEDIIEKYIERILFFLNSGKKYKGINITWYGGEPLTGLKSIKNTTERLLKICEERDLWYSASMVTNGLSLKGKLFQELVTQYKVRDFQITLDGLAESHDKRRYTKNNNNPTFDLIFKNIVDCTKTEAYQNKLGGITVRINIDKTNHSFVDPLLEYFVEKGINQYIGVSFAPIVNWGGNDAGKDSLTNEDFAKKEIDWLLYCFDNKIKFSSLLPKRIHYACMVERDDSEVYDAFGNIYTCWEFPYTDNYGGDEHKIGNLNNDYSTFDNNATLRNWSDVIKSGKTWCKECSHLPVCGGGCPKSWYEDTPACPEFKFNYKEKLILDYYLRESAKNEEIHISK
ncbi:SPASM domain-containing protein [Chryseobacterium sp. RG1]|uniref:SPASM domain-containing protein n=1 Tax=Chryseobacterium tagetis TaxID=2801334 RepID=A0ABS8A376_9FLAO|nr:radical SAM protein [Chryseobacterium tagetis]MCA6068398.1 SPASM domain-containing protein [Chryseobacterium tagetis]